MSDVARLAAACAGLLAQARELVLKLDADHWVAPGPGGSASVGAHVRHVTDVCGALLAGLAAGRVDYDRRPRDPRIESEPAAALERLEALRDALLAHVAHEPDRALRVRSDEPDLPPHQGFVASSLARELRAVASHALHHFALIAVVLRGAGIAVDARFGVAPSTPRDRLSSLDVDQ